ncbi:MAG: preprotein translocase subunit YajC [Acutalibacteraceae bacterium]
MFNNLIAANSAAGQQAGASSMIMMLVVYGLIFAALYFFMIRPSSKRKKQEAELRNNVTIGDEITTIGGLVGKIVAIKEDTDTLIMETGTDRCRIRITRWAIASVVQKTEE